jgi:hypothetical protein
MGLDEAGPAEVEAGVMLAAAFFSAACRIWSLIGQLMSSNTKNWQLTPVGSNMHSIRPIRHNPHSLFLKFARPASHRPSFQ